MSATKLQFTKMQGLGNDYVYVDCTKKKLENASEVAVKVSDRHFGIGSDGLILINASRILRWRCITRMDPAEKCAEMVSVVLQNMCMITD